MRRLAALLAVAAALGGCGVGAGEDPGTRASLTVTRDFGAEAVVETAVPEIAASDTVMRLLQRNADVDTRFGGGFVQAVEGVAGGREDGRPVDWFYYVNGLEAAEGAAATDVRPGDRIWWDRHDWGTAARIPAVVGSFPEPFVRGTGGRRLPVRIECPEPEGPACEAVRDTLVELGVPAARAQLGTDTKKALRVLVGSFAQLRRAEAPRRLQEGPEASGVFARFTAGGRRLVVFDPRGRPARTLGAGTGLVAATATTPETPVWLVTGTDEVGVRSAARAFTETALADRFALAVSDDLPVPVPAEARP